MTTTRTEMLSPRLTDLKADLVARIPTRNLAARADLATKSLDEVVILYLTWQARLIRPRRRDVIIWPDVTGSPHHAIYADEIANIETQFRAGDDMNPYLSDKVRTNAYAAELPPPTTTLSSQEWARRHWSGKDRVRVTVDAHHLHLGGRKPDATIARSGPLLFAGITPDRVFFLTIGDHKSFGDGTVSQIMYEKLNATLAAKGGGVALVGPMTTLGGTQVKDTMRSIEIMKRLRVIDHKLTNDGHPTTDDRVMRLQWDDILVSDPSSGQEVERVTGRL